MEKIRLQKFFTDNKIMSRRSAEKVIEAGCVKINGTVAHLGDKVDPENDVIEYNGRVIKPCSSKKTYIMLNKPLGYVTTTSDEKGRETVLSLVKDLGERVYPVGRLDMYSEGLLILTNAWSICKTFNYAAIIIKVELTNSYEITVVGSICKGVMVKCNLTNSTKLLLSFF